ncbi:MAG: deoxyribodipyrimidine photo-lyase [Candidatus Methylacidiphilales bacterium]|nr:deoxyribodipyrimidine photo-lyase [Candidatus Methylacidiphilales bacterium]
MKTALVWFRRDLRLEDNTALHRALSEAEQIVPVFVFDPKILSSPDVGGRRVAYLLACLDSLDKNLRHIGGRLILREGDPVTALRELAREAGAEAVFWNKDYEPFSLKRDAAVEAMCGSSGLAFRAFDDQCVHAPGTVLKQDGTPYTVFTPFSRAWKEKPEPSPWPRPKSIRVPGGLAGAALPTLESLGHRVDIELPPAGERAAHESMKAFLAEAVGTYKSQRDIPSVEGTSRLSPHLRFGTLSPRTVLAGARAALSRGVGPEAEIGVFVNELIWREFYKHILHHFPHVESGCFRKGYDALAWENDKSLFAAWCEGRTGYPIVDAGMRQLNQTGWMHNRLRMITASFLTKDLLIDWKWGERYFMKQLLDGDLAANNGGWQWAAGTGTDAQPYFRIFNPSSQTAKFDPEEKFIRRYVPEVDTPSYPRPVVVHSEQRDKALALYKTVRDAGL